jgi:hypothetical protein
MRRLSLVLAICVGGCASSSAFHEGRTALVAKEKTALLGARPKSDGGFQRFWRRPGVAIGVVKWSEETSSSVDGSPRDLLQAIRDELGRVNRVARTGEDVHVTVIVFRWKAGIFSSTPEVGYEVVGRDRAGQVLWMGEDVVHPSRSLAANLAEGDEAIVAREVGRKIRKELQL